MALPSRYPGIQRMMMKNHIAEVGAVQDVTSHDVSHGYDVMDRLSPHVGGIVGEEVYRCPVSTPTVTRRPSIKGQCHQPFIAFSSMNRSLRIPNELLSSKQFNFRSAKSRRPQTKPQRKNFDYYFVKESDKPVYIDAQMQSTWLNSLCSQPVNEIFGKYKRKSESFRNRPPARSTNSTPGEKALYTGWSCNVSSYGSPSVLSKSTASGSGYVALSRTSYSSSLDPNLRVYGYESDPDRIAVNPGFALFPTPPTTSNTYDDDDIPSSRGSPLFQKVFKNNANPNSASMFNTNMDLNVYEPYQRDKRFPEIRQRKSTLSPSRKRISVADGKDEIPPGIHLASAAMHDLQESPMQIVSIGQRSDRSIRSEKSDVMEKQISDNAKQSFSNGNLCAYRLPKNPLTMSLPELHGKG
ncbi:uncharacterized protein LOC127853202 isoform X2 [Dreissena polymorpha]|uniref:uncharacterized protein LOC127853202 isoform X2 n=2 Tax=Dreissena polymorpha TaxID=45954 RepID=UPI002264DE8C|nr:uncharacterized protein LOC127853202 isoform X2 [Dreissena polymorpha]